MTLRAEKAAISIQGAGIDTFLHEGSELGDDAGAVLLEGHAEPAGRGGEHLAGTLAGLDDAVHGEGDVEFLRVKLFIV